ncbi:MAG: lysophospholipid acyltransferase family protein [Chloroflexia bacterium]
MLARLFNRVSPGLKFRGFQVLSRIAGAIPLKLTYAVAVLIGDFIYYFWHEHSRNAVSNMRHVLGPDASERAVHHTARSSFRNYAKTLSDFIRFPYTTASEIDRRLVRHHGLELMEQALAGGKGLIAVTGHLGNWDFAGAFMGKLGIPMYALADKIEPPELDALVIQTRLRNGLQIIKMEAGSMRHIFEALRRNEVVFLLVDRPMPDEGIPVTFFGETAWLPSGPAAIALKTGAPILIGSCLRLRGNVRYVGGIETLPEYKHLLTGNKQDDIRVVTQAIATALEGLIRRAPNQWYMFRPMWPSPAIAAELAEAPQEKRRRARRLLRAVRTRQSINRLRARFRVESAPDTELTGTALGISVDPPDVEDWVGGRGTGEH